ncbi:MAG: uncharacterized protein KVP18_004455 [Porospora cf. gigantea A]|uniref:uncharacterized protein n=1 Tax=Porospora cf. gigantea A TaxID=2853593 RepID=UPI00355AA1B2|nr:MAG: hypothetical protein KVP18_004455 [Porospora cf. gigantea A]
MRVIQTDVGVEHGSGAALLGSLGWFSAPNLCELSTDEKTAMQADSYPRRIQANQCSVGRVDVTSQRYLNSALSTASTSGSSALSRPSESLMLSWGTPIVTDTDDAPQVTFLQDRSGMDLKEFANMYLNDAPPKLSFAIDLLESLCQGLVKLRELGIVHEDMRPENVMCIEDEYCFRFIDYDSSRLGGITDVTLTFSAPEKLCATPFSCYASDVWSVALTAAGSLDARIEAAVESAVLSGNVSDVPMIVCRYLDNRLQKQRFDGHDVVVSLFIKMIADMLHLDPRSRPKPADVIEQCQEARWNYNHPETETFSLGYWNGYADLPSSPNYEQVQQEGDVVASGQSVVMHPRYASAKSIVRVEAAANKAAANKAAANKAAANKAAADKAAADKAAAAEDEAASMRKHNHKKHGFFSRIRKARSTCAVS